MALDSNAMNILTGAYWSKSGRGCSREVTPDDFAYAKAHGLMFDPVEWTHDESVAHALSALAAVNEQSVASAFLASLSSRRLDLRSSLGSFAAGRHMRVHPKILPDEPPTYGEHWCLYCGAYGGAVDLNVLSFERVKWGGVRHTHPEYIALDLTAFHRSNDIEPTEEDRKILRAIFKVADTMPTKAGPNQLDKALGKIFPSNSSERRTLIGILGYAGILIHPDKPNFREEFVPSMWREKPAKHHNDWPYPVEWWQGAYRVNRAAVEEWFGPTGLL